jgi:hypothetical protein
LGGRRQVPIHYQMIQEPPHVGYAQLGSVPKATETDEPLGP